MLSRTLSAIFMLIVVASSFAYGLRDELALVIAMLVFTELYNIASISNKQKPNYGIGQCSKPTLLYYALSAIIPINFYLSITKISDILLVRILLIVWITDSFSCILGNIFKGPKLSVYSPQKTWSGFIGGICFGLLFCRALKIHSIIPFAVQLGDILESMVKRSVNIKDSNYFLTIPGHGGILDRIDGLLAALICHQLIYADSFSISI